MKIPNIYKQGLFSALTGTGRIRKADINDMYMNMLTLVAANEHDYEPPDYNKYFYEAAIMTGCAAFYKCPDKSSVNYGRFCCTPARPAAVIDNMLTAKRITTAGSDYALELTVDRDCILIYNNTSMYPSLIFCKLAEDMTETALSMSKLVKWSRMTPIPKAKTDTDIAKYTQIMKRILEGEDINVISDELSLLSEGHSSLDDNVLRLTDETAVQKLHFFDEHFEQILRRFATIRGLPFSTTAKSSQNLVEELHDMDAFSTFMIEDEIRCRREGFERAERFMKEKYDIDYSFNYKPSDVLQRQLDRTAIEYITQLAEADRIESEASQKASQAIKFEAEAEKLESEAELNEQTYENTEEGEINDQDTESAAEGDDSRTDNTSADTE